MSFLLVSLGTTTAVHDGFFNLTFYIIAIVGVTLAQNAVNVLNDYHDFKTGVDARTMKTPFSGGSRFLVSGFIRSRSALLFGITFLLLALLYAAIESLAVILILISVLARMTPVPTLLALVCLPFALKAIRGTLRHYDDVQKLILALAANIATAYVTITLLAVGYLISIVLGV